MKPSSVFHRSLLLAAISVSAQAADQPYFSVGADVGTLGIGGTLAVDFNDRWGMTFAAAGFSTSYDVDAEDDNGVQGDELNHQGDVRLVTGGAWLHYRPFGGSFRMVGGAVFNGSDVINRSRCDNDLGCELGNSRFQPQILGTVTTRFNVQPIAPYLGVGWSQPPAERDSWYWVLDLGLAYLGDIDAEISSDGVCNESQDCRDSLAEEERELEDEINELPVYPVLNLGLRFGLGR